MRQVIKEIDFETLLKEMKAHTVLLAPELAPFLELESEPALKLLQVCAYFRALDRAEFNDGAKACMLALATGTDLENLAAYWGIERLVIVEADDSVFPPIEEVLEDDDALRRRTQLAPEGLLRR